MSPNFARQRPNIQQRVDTAIAIHERLQRAFPRLLIEVELTDYGTKLAVSVSRSFRARQVLPSIKADCWRTPKELDDAVLGLGRHVLSTVYPHGLAVPA